MILGTGLDLVEISRVERIWRRFGMRFAEKILHPDEMHGAKGVLSVQFLASRFAAKEAAVKALGTGFSDGIVPSDVAVVTLDGGRPVLRFFNKAHERCKTLGVANTHISLTHGKETVAAMVILEGHTKESL